MELKKLKYLQGKLLLLVEVRSVYLLLIGNRHFHAQLLPKQTEMEPKERMASMAQTDQKVGGKPLLSFWLDFLTHSRFPCKPGSGVDG